MDFNPLQVLSRIKYKPNVRVAGEFAFGSRDLVLRLIYRVPNSTTDKNEVIEVCHQGHIPVEFLTDEMSLLAFVRNRIFEAECHEADEWLRFQGELLNDPHRNDR